MPVEVEFTNEFELWWADLDADEQESVTFYVRLLEEKGANLTHPYCSGIRQSRHSHMRELRIQHRGNPYRVLYAFDPRRMAILLIGGEKTSTGNAWYDANLPVADRLYDEHLLEIAKDGASEAKHGS